MPTTFSKQYTGDYLTPLYDPIADPVVDNINLAPGSYNKGHVVAFVAGSGTAVNDVQTLTVTGTPTGGSVVIHWNGNNITVPYNASAAAVQALFDALSNIGTAGNITVGGGALPGTALTFTFQGDFAGQPQAVITVVGNALTGGTNPAASIAHTTTGSPAAGYWVAYVDGSVEPARRLLQYKTTVTPDGKHAVGGGELSAAMWAAPSYSRGTFKTSELTGLDANGVADLGKLTSGTTSTLSDTKTVLRVT